MGVVGVDDFLDCVAPLLTIDAAGAGGDEAVFVLGSCFCFVGVNTNDGMGWLCC